MKITRTSWQVSVKWSQSRLAVLSVAAAINSAVDKIKNLSEVYPAETDLKDREIVVTH